jgi:nucleoside-diphosphate-sugar epimerase
MEHNSSVSLLITGAGGWFGSALLTLLESNRASLMYPDTLVVLGEFDPPSLVARWSRFAEVRTGDLLDPSFLETIPSTTNLIHAAAVIHPPSSLKPRRRDLFAVNKALTLAAFSKVLAGGAVVLLSSVAAEGFNSSRPRPLSGYGESKLACEAALVELAARNNLRASILRAAWFHGVNPPPRQLQFDRLARHGLFPCPTRARRRSISNVEDVALASLAALQLASAPPRVLRVAQLESPPFDVLLSSRRPPTRRFALKFPTVLYRLALVLDTRMKSYGWYLPALHVLGELSSDLYYDPSVLGPDRAALGLPDQVSLSDLIDAERR